MRRLLNLSFVQSARRRRTPSAIAAASDRSLAHRDAASPGPRVMDSAQALARRALAAMPAPRLRPEILASILPLLTTHETTHEGERGPRPLRPSDALAVLRALRSEAKNLRDPRGATFATWITASWSALGPRRRAGIRASSVAPSNPDAAVRDAARRPPARRGGAAVRRVAAAPRGRRETDGSPRRPRAGDGRQSGEGRLPSGARRKVLKRGPFSRAGDAALLTRRLARAVGAARVGADDARGRPRLGPRRAPGDDSRGAPSVRRTSSSLGVARTLHDDGASVRRRKRVGPFSRELSVAARRPRTWPYSCSCTAGARRPSTTCRRRPSRRRTPAAR